MFNFSIQVPSGIDNRTQILTLSHNNFQHLRPSSFNHVLLHNLREIDFIESNIHSIDPYTFFRIRNLQTLLVDHNNLKQFDRSGSLISLKKLLFSYAFILYLDLCSETSHHPPAENCSECDFNNEIYYRRKYSSFIFFWTIHFIPIRLHCTRKELYQQANEVDCRVTVH